MAQGLDFVFVGLSPRARGNPFQQLGKAAPHGPIPACAGEPPLGSSLWFQAWAYPRVRGGTFGMLFRLMDTSGLSPRARGNLRP